MGVQNLWKALSKGGAVEVLEGNQQGHHARIVDAVENRVVAVDLSAWLMQAQTQPALLEHYDSPYARAVKVVFDRTIHWLRYGCLPVFVIEGRTPAAKLDKLRARCVAQYGRAAYAYDVGNREGGQFDRLGQAVKGLLEAFGVPCVQAVGEAEAMCAALNVCGWAHAVHTADVDAHLFGALTVYKQVHLQTDDPRRSVLARCCMYDVRRVLGISRGGDAALMAVAHLAGGDYDMGGADNVGEVLALGAVRQLLQDCEDDEEVLQRLEAAVAKGPDPELDALTCCTGCKACGHEGGRKGKIKAHSARNGCDACGCEDGCHPREWTECGCAFHVRADERLLNRVVRRAAATPGFVDSFRTAASTYAEQTRSAIALVQREYGLPAPDGRNVFSWAHRPDVRAISDIMCKYIKEWDYRQVRLKLLPLLLEWDVRQGPSAGPSAVGLVQLQPTSIRKVSSKGAEAAELVGVPTRSQSGWRYVLQVDRLTDSSAGSSAAAAAAADAAAEDLAIDQSWIAGTARSRAPKQDSNPAAAAAAGSTPSKSASSQQPQQQQQQQQGAVGAGSSGDPLLLEDDGYESEPFLATQLPAGQAAASPWGASRSYSSSQAPAQQLLSQVGSQAGSSGSGGGRAASGTLQFAEHRSVRCSLIDALWPHLTAKFRQPAASGGRSRSGASGRKNKDAAGAAAAGSGGAAAEKGERQRTVKDFFGVAKDYTVPGRQPVKPTAAAAADGTIPGLAGLVPGPAGSTPGPRGPAAAAAGDSSEAAAAAGRLPGMSSVAKRALSTARRAPQQSFMAWLEGQQQEEADQQLLQQQQELPSDSAAEGVQQHSRQQQQSPPQQQRQQQQQSPPQKLQQQQQQQQLKGSRSGRPLSARQASLAAAAGRGGSGGGRSAGGMGRRKQGAAKTPCKSGPLDRFLRPAAAVAASAAAAAPGGPRPQEQVDQTALQHSDVSLGGLQEQGVQEQQQEWQVQQLSQQLSGEQEQASPDVPSLAARLAAARKASSAAPQTQVYSNTSPAAAARLAARHQDRGRSRSEDSDDGPLVEAAAAAGAAGAAAGAVSEASEEDWAAPPAKKASTPKAKELLSSPLSRASAARAGAAVGSAAAGGEEGCEGGRGGSSSPPAAGAAAYSKQYQSLLQQLGVASPEQQQQQQQGRRVRGGRAAVAKGLFGPQQQQQGQASVPVASPGQEPECIELLDSPNPVPAPAPVSNCQGLPVGSSNAGGSFEVVDLTFSPS